MEQCAEDCSRKCTCSVGGRDKSQVATDGSGNRFVLLPLPLVGEWLFLFKQKGNGIVLVSLQWGWEESFNPGAANRSKAEVFCPQKLCPV